MKQPSIQSLDRRHFVKGVAAAAATAFGFQFIPSRAWGKLQKPTLAAIGIGGKGAADLQGAMNAGFEIVGLVDVVDSRKINDDKVERSSGKSREMHPQAPFFTDYREMLASLGDRVDAVTVSTPDHHHFHAACLAMKSGKHVYCQKPLTHGLWEARTLARVARETGVKTQMGNQAHALDHMRRCVELIQAGVIGGVREVHGWTNRPIWPQGIATPPEPEPVPAWMNWEQWLGPAPETGYSSKLAPFGWRGAWDYGCGALGDMACHILDLGWWATMPGDPVSVLAEQQGGTDWSPPISSKITWEFAPSRHSSAAGCKFFWYDGYLNASFDRNSWSLAKKNEEYHHPDDAVMSGEGFRNYDTVIVGDYGRLYFSRERATWTLKAVHKLDGFKWPEPTIPRAVRQDNYQEWYDAITGKVERGQSDFAVAGPFTEMILVGTLAQRIPGQKLEWDAGQLEVKGRPETKGWIQRAYRKGWESPV
ncbi:Gfo/Idh/MocA family protein [Verrucomicrobium spinosum]|uniref:Gfo/Idh/MocA family protein n=1 Tax=Verrucomicrobium spinosum TaxID=2736 RepID=UPI000174642E|nr:Gfo/Idh/MocA family oxidoreductase [Verrucomicrobium spinosum]